MLRSVLPLALLLPLLAPAQSYEPPVHQKLIPTLWVQTSVEWRASCLQAYRGARATLDRARKDKRWTAAVEQSGKFHKLKPAIVLDIDETVLDNSPGQARQVTLGTDFVPKDWNEWVREAKAEPIPGAADFCRYAASQGVRVFFITNRDAPQEEATRENLSRAGFPLPTDMDTVFTRGERPDWNTSDKSARRKAVAERYRILMLLGDDLGDFLPGVRVSPEKRAELAAAYAQRWGERWVMLPNPGYGSWEEALYGDPKPADPSERMMRKTGHLRLGR